MGIDKRPSIPDWSFKSHLNTEWYHTMFSCDRVEIIHSSMLNYTETPSIAKEKIKPFLNKLLVQFQAAYYPFEELSLDEMVIGWKGRFKHKTYNATKPQKYHVKTFGLCDSSTGYVYNLLVYFGQETSYDPDLDPNSESAIKVFSTLMKPLERGHHIYADRFYTTRNLIDYLLQNQTNYTGTLQQNRRNFPPQLKGIKLERQESRFFLSEDEHILAVGWRDKKAKKVCIAVSTKAESSVINQQNSKF